MHIDVPSPSVSQKILTVLSHLHMKILWRGLKKKYTKQGLKPQILKHLDMDVSLEIHMESQGSELLDGVGLDSTAWHRKCPPMKASHSAVPHSSLS